jgi:ubiquitin carboxyl-terminal hydrolase 8
VSALSNCLGLTHYILTRKYAEHTTPENVERSEFSFFVNYIKALVALFEKNQTISPKTLRKQLSVFLPNLTAGVQHDAHECLIGILDLLHIASNNKMFNPGPVDMKIHEHLVESRKTWISHFSDGYSVVNHLFFGQYIQKIRCVECGETSYTYQPFVDLSMALPRQNVDKISTIYDVLNEHFKKQVLDKNCEKCKKKTEHSMKTRIIKLPKYLIIHLKRFNNSLKKLSTDIAYSSELEMSKYTVLVENQSVEYRLVSTILHTGSTISRGHYSTTNRVYDNMWVNIDDDVTTEVKPIDVCQTKNIYILIYELDAL